MRERYIPAFIVLVAALITSIINVINSVDILTGLKRLLLVIVIFYVVGIIAKKIISNVMMILPKKEEPEENQEDETKAE